MKVNQKNRIKYSFSPIHIIVIGFIIAILVGGLILSLPFCNNQPIDLLDAFFTATSAVCVTGHNVVPITQQFNIYGQVILMVLIEIGGLGFITLISLFLIFMHKKLSLKERYLIGQSLNTDNMGTMTQLVKRAFKYALSVQLIGMAIFSIYFMPEFGIGQGLFKSLFTSVSAFCNAGFDIVGIGNYVEFKSSISINVTIMALAILGGIGFIVFDDICTKIKEGRNNKYFFRKICSTFAIHSKLVLIMIVILIVIGFAYFYITEFNNNESIGTMTTQDKILTSAFYSVVPRSAGFSTIDVSLFTDACKIGIIVLMLIGGAPGGTAGGIKVTTLAIIFIAILGFLQGKKHTKIFSREISIQTVIKSFAILTLYLIVIVISITALTISDDNNVLDLGFEVVSAIGNVGLTTGLVSDFSDIGKLNIMLLMYLGRVGTITMALAFVFSRPKISEDIRYPEEKIIVG